ncbi:glycoside hydrolase family 16 protein [Cantharellus anzutake]|uniref:glycoside hydrolase family 16 protein n=1 Tax=Cantharellus anzutake TaxID=1750568 RepID=UPI001903929C|nr:glycoside hydrolase family 16 protein [Cantharellus anzutake]KAF8341316.1 glycoside hydrolase family 16 protein [Cantharellus anzutake]
MKQNYTGSNFFNGWTFFTYADPTHGVVQYRSAADSWSLGLVSINNAGNAIMKVDTTPTVSGNRNSVRIQTSIQYTGGLIILDAVHMPIGCGTWPAFWSVGPANWPNNGEIDVIEGVHFATRNQMSIHTTAGCTMPANYGASGYLASSGPQATNCDVVASGGTGCGIVSPTPNDYGTGFNSNGGGVYAMKWDTSSGGSGISVWFFPRGGIPFDISTKEPQTSGWGIPQGHWPASTCNPSQFFNNHVLVFDTTLCGDWAGASSVWNSATQNGQTGGSCAARTGYANCADFVRAQGGTFSEAYWEVKSVQMYQ